MSSVQITPQELEEMLNRAAIQGAKKALEDLGPVLTASPDQITAIMGMDGLAAQAAMGLTVKLETEI